MKKALVVSYLPSGEYSNTKQLLDYFFTKAKNIEIEHLDLIEKSPVFFGYESMGAYYTRNYQGKELTESQKQAIAPMDAMCEQFAKADVVIFAHPMHNFSLPGIIKTYLDSVMQKGVAFDYGKNGPYGKLGGKKVLVLYTSGGSYSPDTYNIQYPNWNTLEFTMKVNFSFAGITDYAFVTASTGNPAKTAENIEKAKIQVEKVISDWQL
ncbi:MAG: NAD(P)H-dependent oxidoreductase [Lentimicrobiaceae bacterium]|nr:NAD(P)H-dependent oxidoreductase [Lentimicrobiaceae bacterium]